MSKNLTILGQNFQMLKRAPGPLWHEINVEKWFLDQYSAKEQCLKFRKF